MASILQLRLIQSAVDSVVRWSRSNKLQLNVDKCKELTIDFKRIRQSFVPISINDKDLDYVTEVKPDSRPKHLK